MFLDPVKMITSLVLSMLILVTGSVAMSDEHPQLANTQLLPPFASNESLGSVATVNQLIGSSDTSESAKIDEQISKENAIIEVEAMMASVDTDNPNNSSYNDDDWSLETISDHALEINR